MDSSIWLMILFLSPFGLFFLGTKLRNRSRLIPVSIVGGVALILLIILFPIGTDAAVDLYIYFQNPHLSTCQENKTSSECVFWHKPRAEINVVKSTYVPWLIVPPWLWPPCESISVEFCYFVPVWTTGHLMVGQVAAVVITLIATAIIVLIIFIGLRL